MEIGQTPDPVLKGARSPYVSARRDTQARETRRAIVAAASELFLEHGYAATTIDAIARRAGVGRKTVFTSVGGKGALLKLAWDWAIAGDDEPLAMAERPAVQAMLAERDPERLVRMWVAMLLDVGSRTAGLGAVVFAAADVDTEARALSDLIRRESLAGATAFVAHLAGVQGLRPGLSRERAADACWALINSQLLNLLLVNRGWSMSDYRDWLVSVVGATLLEPGLAAEPRPASALDRGPPEVRIELEPRRERYQASVGGRNAGHLSYASTERLLVLTRTVVEPEFESAGVPGALVQRALDDVRADGARRVLPACPYVVWWIGQHPDYASLVDDGES